MAKKKSGKRRKQRRSKLPFLVLVALVIGAGGYYWYDSREPASIVPGALTTVMPDFTASPDLGRTCISYPAGIATLIPAPPPNQETPFHAHLAPVLRTRFSP